jgi:hypothetical protein
LTCGVTWLNVWQLHVNARRKTELSSSKLGPFEFRHHHPDNTLTVENYPGGVIVCATHDNLSPSQRRQFIRYLAAEGFIPHRSASDDSGGALTRVQWLVPAATNHSALETSKTAQRTSLLTITLFGFAGLLLLTLLSVLYLTRP